MFLGFPYVEHQGNKVVFDLSRNITQGDLAIPIASEHTADAAAIAICHAHLAKWQEKLAT